MKVNKKTDLAIRILKYLYKQHTIDYISGNTIAGELNISYNHLRRIVPLLNELGFTNSKMGKDGGIKLCNEASTIPIKNLLLKTEVSSGCVNNCSDCIFNNSCKFEKHTKKAVIVFCDYFSEIYIHDL